MLTFDERVKRRVKRKNNRLRTRCYLSLSKSPQVEQTMLPF